MDDDNDLSYISLFVSNDSCTVFELLVNMPLGLVLGLDSNGKYAVVTEILGDVVHDRNPGGRQICLGDVLLSINEHMTLNDDVSDIVLFLDTLKECGLQRKLTFLDPAKVAEAAHIQTRTQSKDLLGFSRDLDYLLGEKVYNNANLNLTAQRDLEWVAYLKHIGGPDNLKPAGNFAPSAELKYMVRRGIPAAFRSLIWQKVSLSSIHRLSYPINYYDDLKSRSPNLNKKVADDIEKDVKRTFPEHEYFDRGVGGDSLRFVLKAYAVHNPSVGYCQSLNFITGMMLLFLQEEDAFWLLLTVVDTLLPKDCYSKSMIGTHVDQLVFSQIIETSLPKIHKALVDTQMQISLVTVPWFMCLFVNTLRPEVTLRVWDMFFCEGSKVLFRISAALLKKNEAALIAASCRDSTELFMEMKKIGRNELDADALIAMAYKSYAPPSLKIKQRRMFTSRSTGNLISGSRGGTVDPPLRKYNEFSGVPSDLIGMGVAHTGPMVSSKSYPEPIGQSTSLSSESKDHDPPTPEGMKSIILSLSSTCSVDSDMIYRKDILLNPSPLNASCLSLFRTKPSDPQALSLAGKSHSGSDESKNYNADCCFDKSAATAILQLGISTFNTASGEGKTALSVSADVSPSSIADLSRVISSPTVMQDIRNNQRAHLNALSPKDVSMTSNPVHQKKKKAKRNGSSLFNMLLYARSSPLPPSDQSDHYRSFKRAEIERLRFEFRPAIVERFVALESVRAARYRQESGSTDSPPS